MTPQALAARIVPRSAEREPFPHFVRDDALPHSLARGLLTWLDTGARWRLHAASFFEQYELDLQAVSPAEDCRILFDPATLDALASRYGALFDRRMTTRAHVTAHKLVGGQTIGIHTDEPRGDRETHRLLIQVNHGWRAGRGGELLLLASDDIEALRAVVEPLHNRAVGFEMSDRSFHAVARVHDWTRYTLIFSFWADDRPIPGTTQHVVMPQRERVRSFLADLASAATPHSGGSFLDHLEGVERTLDRWGAPLDTRLAGLMHSIYGTEGFALARPVDPNHVEALVGPSAAALIAIFCAMDSTSLVDSVVADRCVLRARDGTLLDATPAQIDALLLIHLANTAEQLPRLRHLSHVVAEDRAAYERLRLHVPQAARAELDALFDRLADRVPAEARAEETVEALRTFIEESGGDDVLWGRTTLLGRLCAMEEWLARHAAAPELRIAALAHGLYGWKADFSDRNRALVRVVAGDAAERLAWLFAASDDGALQRAGVHPDVGRLELRAAGGGCDTVTRNELEALEMLSRAARETL